MRPTITLDVPDCLHSLHQARTADRIQPRAQRAAALASAHANPAAGASSIAFSRTPAFKAPCLCPIEASAAVHPPSETHLLAPSWPARLRTWPWHLRAPFPRRAAPQARL